MELINSLVECVHPNNMGKKYFCKVHAFLALNCLFSLFFNKMFLQKKTREDTYVWSKILLGNLLTEPLERLWSISAPLLCLL